MNFNIPETWKDQAYAALLNYAECSAGPFTIEDVRADNPMLEETRPRDKRIWGGVTLRARTAGRIINVGYTNCKDRKAHARLTRLWSSVA